MLELHISKSQSISKVHIHVAATAWCCFIWHLSSIPGQQVVCQLDWTLLKFIQTLMYHIVFRLLLQPSNELSWCCQAVKRCHNLTLLVSRQAVTGSLGSC